MTAAETAVVLEERVRESLAAQERLLEPACLDTIARAAEAISGAFAAGGKLLLFGNGGSAADATHIAAEFVGRFLVERDALPALSLSDNASAVTAIGNDYGYERVFARQIEALAGPRDVALGISTSGGSANVLAGVAAARALAMTTIALTGGDGGALAAAVDIAIVVPSESTPRIQECHTLVAHLLCELAEQSLLR
jgi:D-sedoheptulose 7-phosphate isomerase